MQEKEIKLEMENGKTMYFVAEYSNEIGGRTIVWMRRKHGRFGVRANLITENFVENAGGYFDLLIRDLMAFEK